MYYLIQISNNGLIYKKNTDFCPEFILNIIIFIRKMSILSITFHVSEYVLDYWKIYINDTLHLMTENLLDVEKYIISEVESEMISEGKNFNLLLIFENDELKNQFLESEMMNIEEIIANKFGNDIIIFKTMLHPIKSRY